MNWNILEAVYTILAFYIAWFVFFVERRASLRQKKETKINILKSIQAEMELMNEWLGESYDKKAYRKHQEPWHTFHMVYGLERNESIKNAISSKSIFLLSEDLIKSLVILNQQLSSFEQHVERLVKFNAGDPVTSTRAFYYYDRVFAKYRAYAKKWSEFDKLASKLDQNKNLLPEEIHLIGSIRLLEDLHLIGIGSSRDENRLNYRFNITKKLISDELKNINSDKQFKSKYILLDSIIFVSPVALLVFLNQKGGGNIINLNNLDPSVLIVATSLVLGYIKYMSLVDQRKGWSNYRNFVEFWNSVMNFLLAGFVGYFFFLTRWTGLTVGSLSVSISDFLLFIIVMLGLFGHLSVISYNLAEGIQAIISRVLERK